jgi:hypothetical protein
VDPVGLAHHRSLAAAPPQAAARSSRLLLERRKDDDVSRRILVLAVLAAALLTVPTTAWAKGASKGTVQGGGLSAPVTISGEGEPGSGELLARLAEETGAYVAMYGEDGGNSGTLSAARPAGNLGTRYLVTYTIPSPAGGEDAVRQDLYPFAHVGPVTFTTAGQHFMDGMETTGGWFQAPAALRETLAAIGVRKTASQAAALAEAAAKPAAAAAPVAAASDPSGSTRAAPLLAAGGVAVMLLLGGLATVVLRRRSGSESG